MKMHPQTCKQQSRLGELSLLIKAIICVSHTLVNKLK